LCLLNCNIAILYIIIHILYYTYLFFFFLYSHITPKVGWYGVLKRGTQWTKRCPYFYSATIQISLPSRYQRIWTTVYYLIRSNITHQPTIQTTFILAICFTSLLHIDDVSRSKNIWIKHLLSLIFIDRNILNPNPSQTYPPVTKEFIYIKTQETQAGPWSQNTKKKKKITPVIKKYIHYSYPITLKKRNFSFFFLFFF